MHCDISALSNLQTDSESISKENDTRVEGESPDEATLPDVDESLSEIDKSTNKEISEENRHENNDDELPDLDLPSENDACDNETSDATRVQENESNSSPNEEENDPNNVTIKKEIEDKVPELLGSAKEELLASVKEEQQEVESEVYCAKCHDGGELYCCDRCPKVYHLECYIPPMKKEPPDDWVLFIT